MVKVWLYAFVFIIPAPRVAAQRYFPQPRVPLSGSPLLFDDWVKANVVSHSSFFENDSLMLFNFNLATQMLIATVDKQTQYKINRKEFQSVTFYNGEAALTFEHVPEINDRDLFCEVVRKEDRYSLYSLTHSNIRGNAYVELTEYYIVFPRPDVHSVRLRTIDSRLIRHAFVLNPDRDKVEAYFLQHANEEMNGYFLKKMIEYLDE